MRIALVCPYSLEIFGGVQSQVLGLARALGARDEVTVISPGGAGHPGLDVLDVGPTASVPVNGSRAPVALSPRAWARTRAAIEQSRVDVVHIHEPFVPAVGVAALTAGRPVVATFHRAGVGPLYRAVGPLLAPLAARIAAASAVSEEAAATIRAVLGHRAGALELLPNGIDLSLYGSATPTEKHARTLLFVGRFDHRKGLSVLLDALALLKEDVELQIIGTGPEEQQLRARASEDPRIRFLGPLDDDEKVRWLRAATLFVAPSLGGESFGVVLLEAMAAGTPVIASDLPGYRLAGGEAVEFTRAGDADSLAATIRRMLDDEARRAELVELGKERAALHSFERLAECYRPLYDAALRGSRWSAGG